MPVVAYLGPEKTNTHFAARRKFGAKARYLHAPTVEDVFQLVERRKADFGVVPVENSLEGSITHTLDRFIRSNSLSVKICGEIETAIQHCLITQPGTQRRQVRAVFSHPQALAQCRSWLQKHLPRADRIETTSTSEAINLLFQRTVKLGDGSFLADVGDCRAAVGRSDLAKERGLISVKIPQDRENKTRFLVIGLKEPGRGKRNKTSLLVRLKDKPGALHDALVPFKKNRINLTKIESRPSKRKVWEYVFFIDCEGHKSDASLKKALAALRRSAAECRVLGSYPTEGTHGLG